MESDWAPKNIRHAMQLFCQTGIRAPTLNPTELMRGLLSADAEIARLREEVKGLQLMLDCHNEDVECPRSCDTDG